MGTSCYHCGGKGVDYLGHQNGCHEPNCECSVPIYWCHRCHQKDYGDNAEARAIVRPCKLRKAVAAQQAAKVRAEYYATEPDLGEFA